MLTPPASRRQEAAERPEEDAMWLQKERSTRLHELATARATGRKGPATFVPGNLNELLMCFDLARSLPETNALQNGMRKKRARFITDAERDGHSRTSAPTSRPTSA